MSESLEERVEKLEKEVEELKKIVLSKNDSLNAEDLARDLGRSIKNIK